ncbi:alanine dehydrogenase [Pelagicoccus sp. SDUM812003]|uniref:alanine dehydrogenase n=1 Tax=Pelagicoccus sp. SDUM812003 TaxID=3041267 RepID=UPI00281027DD|nr:alanine dehydrogenase [Pelagicoccus sp. SDUM812003]MDQ8204760.1 alanine dehydrogenase [Pelagicoccus sp. SDUM812003]
MIIGVVREKKSEENRVGLIPSGVEALRPFGHEILVETQAGAGSDFSDSAYEEAGAEILESNREVFQRSDLVVKVKEPLPEEYDLIRKGQILFTYFHFAASQELTEAMARSGCIALAYETIQEPNGYLPLLMPMSEVAGRMAIQQAAKYLEREHGGRGVLFGGVPGVAPANVVIIGAGVVGSNAARMAAGLGARVQVLDIDLQKLRHLSDTMPPNVISLMSNPANIRSALAEADVVVSSVLIPGSKSPKLVKREHLALMRKGAVIVDVAIDQGGSTETSRPTSHKDPIFVVDGIIHYCVTNMPGAMPVTSTLALTNATLPVLLEIANKGWRRSARERPAIAKGLNMVEGKITYQPVADAFDLPFHRLDTILDSTEESP